MWADSIGVKSQKMTIFGDFSAVFKRLPPAQFLIREIIFQTLRILDLLFMLKNRSLQKIRENENGHFCESPILEYPH